MIVGARGVFAVRDTMRTPSVALTYTPATDFTGADALTFEAIDADGQDKVLEMTITVMTITVTRSERFA